MKILALSAMFAGMWLVIDTGPVDTVLPVSKHESVAAHIAEVLRAAAGSAAGERSARLECARLRGARRSRGSPPC